MRAASAGDSTRSAEKKFPTLCQWLDGKPLSCEEHHVLEGASICFVCQVVSLDLGERDEPLGHPHKLHIHLGSEGQQRRLKPPDIT